MTHYSNTRNPIDFPKKKEIPMLERFAAQSLVEHNGELIFSKEKFAELIVRECIDCARGAGLADDVAVRNGLGFNDGISEAVTHMKKHFGVEE